MQRWVVIQQASQAAREVTPPACPWTVSATAGRARVGFRPGGGPEAIAYQERTGIKAPRIIAWEITRSCNLSCAHCRASAEFGYYSGELSLEQIKATIDDIVTISNPIIILTGGEPLMRPDIWEIVDYAHEKGAMPVIGTNATLITEDIAQKMSDHGIPRISVSVDFPTAEDHDRFRGEPGCFDATIAGIKMAKAHGVGVQINTTVTTLNAHLIDRDPRSGRVAERRRVPHLHARADGPRIRDARPGTPA